MKKVTVKEKLDGIYNYRFECSQDYIDQLRPITDALIKQVEEMRKALGFYADKGNYAIYSVDSDEGEIARKALKGVETK